MKRILPFCLLIITLTNCQRKDVTPDKQPEGYIKPLHLVVEPRINGIALGWQPMIYFEEGMFPGPGPVAPSQYEIYVSLTDENALQKVATVSGSVRNYTLTNLPEGKTVFAQVKAIHPTLTGSESPVVTTNVGTLGRADLLFTDSPPSITFGSWSGSTLVYANWSDTWIIRQPDGTLNTLKAEGSSPVLSPDGKFIAYLAGVNTNTSYTTQLFIKDVASGATRLLESKASIHAFEWSSDSQSIAFIAFQPESGRGVWLRNITEAASTLFYTLPIGPKQLETDRLDWSPDGRHIVVSLGMSVQRGWGGELVEIPTNGASAQVLLSSNWEIRQPTYSPDGTRLAFISNRAGYRAIWTYEFQTGRLRHLTGSEESFYHLNRLDWKNNHQLTYTVHMPSPGDSSLKVVAISD